MIRTGYGYLAAADPTAMATAAQASCLLALEQADAIGTAVRAQDPGRVHRQRAATPRTRTTARPRG